MAVSASFRTGPVGCIQLDRVAIVVDDYDMAIEFVVERLGFDLFGDSPTTTNLDGPPVRLGLRAVPGSATGRPSGSCG
jgi:hypothetical protein